jgi:DNA polymerase elongation subunit (family B)
MPSVLQKLLASRKATRKLIKYKTVKDKNGNEISGLLKKNEEFHELTNKEGIIKIKNENVVSITDTYDDFMKNVLDKRQLGYKMTANSLYGQCGAKTSAFYDKDIAASTTATGRKLLMYAKQVVEDCYGNNIVDTKYGKMKTKAEYIYGDTDSVFFTFNLEDMDGQKIRGKKALEVTIDLAVEVEKIATKFLKAPHTLEYEKTFMPFLLLSKKRYVGMLHEFDINKGKRKSMGIVLKRRDNAPCVKDAYGGIVDILMKEKDVNKAIKFLKQYLNDMIEEKIPLDKLIISKSLRGFYKNPESIAHKVLADRMGKRDPGNKPAVGSRVPFIFIQTKGKVKLQGDKIEHPSYVIKNNIKPDYIYYITNQLMKPIQQIFSLLLNQIPEFRKSYRSYQRRINSIKRMYRDDYKKCNERIEKESNKHVKQLIFEEFLRRARNNKNGQKTIDKFFGR